MIRCTSREENDENDDGWSTQFCSVAILFFSSVLVEFVEVINTNVL